MQMQHGSPPDLESPPSGIDECGQPTQPPSAHIPQPSHQLGQHSMISSSLAGIQQHQQQHDSSAPDVNGNVTKPINPGQSPAKVIHSMNDLYIGASIL